MLENYQNTLFSPDFSFEKMSEEVWKYQFEHNELMKKYGELLGSTEMQFLPIALFKQYEIKTEKWETQQLFESSGTTGQIRSKHHVKDLAFYGDLTMQAFHQFFPKKKYRILALLPSYLERETSSLVQMVKTWIEHFGLPNSGFYLYNFDALQQAIYEGAEADEPILLIGVAFALIDFAEFFNDKLPQNTIVMETGGMKGRKKEWTRTELHTHLKRHFQISHIYSEYGMTELMSQAYLLEDGRFHAPPWLQMVISDVHLPSLPLKEGLVGRVNVIDLGNIHTCAFISTDDLGRKYADGSFEILGRIDNSELRGCNLLYQG
ncbi:MAG: acyl transferase [Bacteroidia bacterium]